jgi:hypothetical protein
MPASIYRMAGRPHFTEVPRVEPEALVSSASGPDVVAVVAVSEEVTQKEEVVVDPPLESEKAEEPAALSPMPNWDPGWSKSQLLAVATKLNLEMSITNTKTEIISALKAATQK